MLHLQGGECCSEGGNLIPRYLALQVDQGVEEVEEFFYGVREG